MKIMCYYRAALAAAGSGDFTNAIRLVQCSLASGEEAPHAMRLFDLLWQREYIEPCTLERLKALVDAKKYRKALRVRLPQTSRTHAIRGLLYAQIGQKCRAQKEFAAVLALDAGNDLAKRALRSLLS